MNVECLSYTPDALNLLLRTKNTRLSNSADDPRGWSEEKKAEHLAYMLDTIKSSWEFVDYVFRIDGVTRAFTHQVVRTRHGSFAQESHRVVDVREHAVEVPEPIASNPDWADVWAESEQMALHSYGKLIDLGADAQDARGLLPTAITTSIIVKFNLRTLHEMAKLRLCTRAGGEYQDVFREMRREVILIHPWTEPMMEVHCVATGTCAFPRYGKKECPVYLPEMDNTAVRERAKAIFWSVRHRAAPKAVGGKAM